MSKEEKINIKITVSEDCLGEFQILAIRKKTINGRKAEAKDVMAEILEKYVDKKREPTTSSNNT